MGEQLNILDTIITRNEHAKERLESKEMLLPGDEEFYKTTLGLNKKRKNKHPKIRTMPKTHQSEMTTAVKEACQAFDPETANKKQIRELRKMLGALSKEKYPRKPKAKKSKKE